MTYGYYSVLQAQAFVLVQEESLTSLEENLRVARERFNTGSAVKTDVLNLEVKLAQAREDVIRASNGLQLAISMVASQVTDQKLLMNASVDIYDFAGVFFPLIC